MDLRHYLQMLRRNAFLIILVVIVAMELAGLQHSMQDRSYEATAEVLLRPENLPASTTNSSASRFDAARYASVELAVITSPRVAEAAAARVPGYTAASIRDAVSATSDEDAAFVQVTAQAPSPTVAADIANAVATVYVEQQGEAAAGDIDQAIAEFDDRLGELEAALAQIDAADPTSPDLIAISEQYSSVFGRQQDLRVQRSLQGPTAEILEVAEPSTDPVGLGLPSKLILAAFLGAAVGFGLAYAREELDDGIRSREEVAELTGFPVLVELPFDRRSSRAPAHLAMADESLGRLAEGVRSLRTSISFLSSDRPGGITRLLVTSTESGDGKTLVAANLAVAYAQAGYRTVLVSADLRRPRLEQVFGIEVGHGGLADAFATVAPSSGSNGSSGNERVVFDGGAVVTRPRVDAVLDRVTLSTRIGNLWLVPAGAPVPNPSELLSSSRMDDVLAELSEKFDMVIVDTSPLLAVTDAAALASKIGHVVLVAGMSGTHRRALSRAAEIVTSTRADVLGIVLNKVTARTASFGSEYRPRTEAEPARGDIVAHAR